MKICTVHSHVCVCVCQRDMERKLGTYGGDMAGNMVKSARQDVTAIVSVPCEWSPNQCIYL